MLTAAEELLPAAGSVIEYGIPNGAESSHLSPKSPGVLGHVGLDVGNNGLRAFDDTPADDDVLWGVRMNEYDFVLAKLGDADLAGWPTTQITGSCTRRESSQDLSCSYLF